MTDKLANLIGSPNGAALELKWRGTPPRMRTTCTPDLREGGHTGQTSLDR
jgi:hypothetical protein